MFITFEGIEGAGKSTAIASVADGLERRGRRVLLTQEPGGCALGKTLRTLLLDQKSVIASRAELFLFLADRAQHVAEVVRPALVQDIVVLCDRYADSTLAYQGYARGLDPAVLRQLSAEAAGGLVPNMTLLLDLPVEEGLARARRRNERLGTVSSEGRFDAESLAFHAKVRSGFLAIASEEPERVKIIDSSRPPAEVQAQCLRHLETLLQG